MKRGAVLLFAIAVALTPAVKAPAKDKQPQFKVAEVDKFTLADGVELPKTINPPHFLSLLPDSVRAQIQKKNIAAATVGEGDAVPDAAAADSIAVEGRITHTRLGFRTMADPPKLTMEINIYRRNGHTLIASVTPTMEMLGGWYSDDEKFARIVGEWVTEELQKALKQAAKH